MGFNFFMGIGGSALVITLLALPGVGLIVGGMVIVLLFAFFVSSRKPDTTRDDIGDSGETSRRIGLTRSKIERCNEERQHKLLLSLLPMFERMQSGEEK